MVEAAFKAIRDHGSRVTFVITELLGLALWLSFWPETQMIHSSNSFGSMHCQFRGALLQCSVSWQQWHSDKSRIAREFISRLLKITLSMPSFAGKLCIGTAQAEWTLISMPSLFLRPVRDHCIAKLQGPSAGIDASAFSSFCYCGNLIDDHHLYLGLSWRVMSDRFFVLSRRYRNGENWFC